MFGDGRAGSGTPCISLSDGGRQPALFFAAVPFHEIVGEVHQGCKMDTVSVVIMGEVSGTNTGTKQQRTGERN